MAGAEANSETLISDSDSLVDQAAVNKLATGLLGLYQPELKKVKQQLDELTKKQGSLIGQLQEENKRFADVQASDELQQMFTMVKHYQGRLTAVKKEMTQLHERTAKLKKRAMKLQQLKQKEALHRQHQKELQLQREEELIAKPSSTNQS
ncbi:biogenesis of lysosome-related organelles complex 1 subunit 6 [Anabrus simplex]|uniref:biogenesis of lysosome-related organelles complex 1 subunit 6 n=1 Tax=Anabrus simplex TaxID=316456 RepID=UPI0035A325BC